MPQKYDLHLHSTFSDGEINLEDLIRECAERKMETVGIADHNTTKHISEAINLGNTYGIRVIPAIEISVFHNNLIFHLLAFAFNESKELYEKIDYFENSLLRQLEKISQILSEFGIILPTTLADRPR